MTVGDLEAHSRPVATGTYNNLEGLFKNFRQHVNPKEDGKDAKEYNALYKTIDERGLELQMKGDLFSRWDHHYADDEQVAKLLLRRRPESL